MKQMRIMLVIGALMGLWGGVWLMLDAVDEPIWNVIGGINALLMLVAVMGMWRLKQWALWTSLPVVLFFLGLGLWIEYIVWDMRFLFEDTTALGVFLEMLDPQVSLLVVIPLVWLIYFFRPAMRQRFR
ncbi:MAG: hypothetical protein JW893_08025 [Candidatus Omnitrophica bacterium]|nr:hypothetical protein [Candidatus Omnitrophota bacterium]